MKMVPVPASFVERLRLHELIGTDTSTRYTKQSTFSHHTQVITYFQVHNVCLFRCDKCEIFFKSKKGYEGHVANRHAPRVVGVDGKIKSKKEMEGLNKVSFYGLPRTFRKSYLTCRC